MVRFLLWLLIAGSLPVAAAETPAKGRLLVATEVIRGDIFVETVVLLLHYDETGAAGLVVNRPTEVGVEEVLPDPGEISDYAGEMYWGGPVQMNSIRALMKSEAPPEGAENIVGSIYLAPFNDELIDALDDASSVRLFIGYSGWAPGQLDHELAMGSWHVLPASDDVVFASEPALIWKQLAPQEDLRTSVWQH
jgi:putative transcriptional regulator